MKLEEKTVDIQSFDLQAKVLLLKATSNSRQRQSVEFKRKYCRFGWGRQAGRRLLIGRATFNPELSLVGKPVAFQSCGLDTAAEKGFKSGLFLKRSKKLLCLQ